MVKIDNKIREVINQIKLAEAKIANLTNKIEDSEPKVSVATWEKSYIVEITHKITGSLALYSNCNVYSAHYTFN